MAENIQPDNNEDVLLKQAIQKNNLDQGRPLDYDPLASLNTTRMEQISPVPTEPILYKKNFVGNIYTGPNPQERKDDPNVLARLSTVDHAKNTSRAIKQSAIDNLDADLLARPYSFNADADGARFARYYNHPKYTSLGFNPYHNNEDLYNKNSTFGDEFSRASGQWLRLVGEGFSSGLRSWGIGGGITPQADIIGAKNMAEAIDIGSSSKGGFGGWATNTWLNSGLSIGIGAEWLAEEFVLSTAIGLSGGALAPELLPVAGARATRAFGLLGKNYERGANLGSQLRNIQNIQEAKSYWDATRTRKILKGAFNIANPIGNTMQSLKGIKYANKEYAALHALNTFGGFARDWIELKAAVNESNLEGGLVKLDVEKELIKKYRAENDGKFPMGEAMKKISETADAEAYTTALNNIPVIFASNNILYETLFKFIKPKYTPAVGDVIRKEAAGTVVLEKSGFKLYDTRLGRIKASGKALLKPKTHFKYMGAYMKANLAEGLQENIQESISEGAINHAIDLYNNDYKYANQTFASHVLDGLKGQFSPKGFETFASGFVTGAISQPIMSAPFATLRMAGDWTINRKKANEYKATRNKQLKSLVESLNKSLEDPLKLFAPEFRNLGAQGKIAQDYLEALANGDVKGQLDAKKSAQIEATLNALYSNGYDALLTKFKDGYLKLADEDLIQAFNRDRKDGEKMFNLEDVPALRSQLNSIVERATKVKERFDWVQENLPNPYEYSIYKEGTEAFEAMRDAHAGWNEMQKSLILGWATYDSNVKRISSIYNDLSSAGAVLSKIRGYDVNLLLSPETRLKEIALLDSEIETLEGNTDAESKKQLEFKKELKDKLLNFHILFADAENRSLYDEEGKTIMSEDLKSKGITLMKTSKDAERNADGTYANGNPVIIKSEGETPLVHIITGIDEETGEYEISRQYTDENGEIQVDYKFVSENDFEILSEESLSEIHKVSHTNEMKQAFVDYIKLFANKNNEIATNDKIDQAFQKIIDYILINKENVNLVKNINFMANPQQMAELSGRFIKAYKSKKAKMRMQMIDSINKIIQKYEWNSALLELYKKGFWVSEKDINRIVAEINSNKPVSDPETFIDVNTYEEVPKDSDKYKKALDIWKAQKEMIVDSFKNYLKQEKKKKHTIVENADKTFSVISPEGTVVGGPLATREDAEKIASALDEALEAEEKAVADDKKKKILIVAGDTDWWNKYNDDPDVLRLKDSILTKLAELTDQNKEDISDDEVYNFLQGSTAALSIINAWNAAREKEGLVKAPELKASNPPKPLEEMSLKDLEDFVSLLENISNKTPDTISDIAEIRAYIGKRKGQTLVKPNTKEQEKAIAKLKEAQPDIANKNDNSKNYIIHNELYDRVTNVVPKVVVDTFGYTFSKNEDNTYSLINYKGEKVGAPFGEYTDDETGEFVTAEENVKKEVNRLNSVLKFSNFLDKKPFIQNKIESFVNDLVSQINKNKITEKEAIEKLFETLFIDSNNYKNGILFELFNENKIKKIKGKLLNQDFTFDNVKAAFNEYAYEHTTNRGNHVDKHVRDFFTNFELGVKPAYFTEEAWTNLGNALIAIRDTLVKQGFNVIANNFTVYDRESKIAGTLDLLLIDAKGNYYIYDIKTGDKEKKWDKYSKASGILPASQAMVENTFQLSLYSNLLQNITGIQTKGLAIFALETTEDLDGNVLTLNAVNNNKAIPIKYDLGITPSPSQKVVPIRAFEKSEVPTTDLPQATEVTSVNVLAEQQLKYLNQYLSNLESKWEEYGKEIDVIDRSIIEQNKQIAAIKSQQSDLGAFLENASEKELKGKKKKIKAQIKELEESLTKAEANLESLLAAKEKIIIDNSKLENFIYVTKDAIKSVESGQIQKKFNMQEYLDETLANLNNRYLDTLVKLENRIEVTQDTISKLREVLMSMGITAELIDAALTNTDILPLLRSKVNEIKLKYFDTREAKKIDRYRGKIQEEYQAEVAPYIELINKLSKKQFKDFKSAYIESIKSLRAQTDKLLKLREDYDNLYNMKETVDSPFNFSAQAKRELLTAINYLENSISILNEAQKVKETKALEEKKAKAPAKPAAKKEPAKKAAPTAPVSDDKRDLGTLNNLQKLKKLGFYNVFLSRQTYQELINAIDKGYPLLLSGAAGIGPERIDEYELLTPQEISDIYNLIVNKIKTGNLTEFVKKDYIRELNLIRSQIGKLGENNKLSDSVENFISGKTDTTLTLEDQKDIDPIQQMVIDKYITLKLLKENDLASEYIKVFGSFARKKLAVALLKVKGTDVTKDIENQFYNNTTDEEKSIIEKVDNIINKKGQAALEGAKPVSDEKADIEKQKEKVKADLLNKKVKTKTGLVLRIIDVKLDAVADNIILYYVSEADNKHNNISYPDFNNALEDGRIIFIAEKTEVAKPVKKEVKKELVLSQDEINNIAQENKKIINVPEQDSVESGEVVAAVINPANGKATPTNSKFKVINLGFIKIIDTTMSPEVVLYGNHVGELRSVGINSGYDEQMDVTSIDGNEYALAEGYASWSDFYFENKKAIDKIAKNESKRVVLIVKPIGIKTKARVPKGEKDLLSEYGFTDPVINAMSDSELAEAIEAAKNQDAGILNMILFRYEKLILPESKTVEEVESEMNNLFTKIMAPEFLDDITDFKNYFDDLLVEISNNINYLIGNNAAERIENLYKDLESKIKDKPLFKNIMKNDVVTIDNTEYVAEKISVDSITFAMLGDVTVKLKIKEDEIPTKVQSISEPIGKVFEEEKVNVTSNEKDLIKASAINEKQLEVTNAILQNKNAKQAKEDSDFKKKC